MVVHSRCSSSAGLYEAQQSAIKCVVVVVVADGGAGAVVSCLLKAKEKAFGTRRVVPANEPKRNKRTTRAPDSKFPRCCNQRCPYHTYNTTGAERICEEGPRKEREREREKKE